MEFIAAMVLMLVGLIYGSYTRTGSGIDHHPHSRRYSDSPAAAQRATISGRDGIASMYSRGTR
jgi:hypothetical protein